MAKAILQLDMATRAYDEIIDFIAAGTTPELLKLNLDKRVSERRTLANQKRPR